MKKQNYIYTIWLGLFSLVTICTGLVSCSEDDNKTSVAPEITLDKTNLVLEVGSSERLTASFNPPEAPNKGHTWTSSAANIATVDETGLVTAIAMGNAVITAQALDGGKMASCNVQVVAEVVHVTGITLTPASESIATGEQLQLTARVLPENATDKSVIWTSSNDAIATVDGTGQVTGIAAGSVVITATSNDGNKQATCQLTVSERGAMISAPEVTDVTSTTAHVSGSIRAMGVEIQERGLCYGTSPSPTVDGQKVTLSGEDVSHTLNGLSERTTYYVRLYAMVDGKVSYGEETEFMTTGEIITNFEATDIYDDRAELVSVAPSGVTSVKICYSESPNPKITDYTTTAYVEEDGLLHLTLENLVGNQDYYLRSYTDTGGSIKYNDDEISFKTIGGDPNKSSFRVKFIYDIGVYGSHEVVSVGNYRVRWTVDYHIETPGTYLVYGDNGGEVGKNYVFSADPIYIESGDGEFSYRKAGGWIRRIDGVRYMQFDFTKYLTFQHMETNVKYHFETPYQTRIE